MGHPVARGHEVQLPRPDELLGAQAVQVEQLAGHQPGHGLQAQVRMRPDAERPTRLGPDGADVIGEAPGPHRAARPLRQDPAHRQASPPGSTRPGATSTTGPSAWSGVPGTGAASSVATGPLIGLLPTPLWWWPAQDQTDREAAPHDDSRRRRRRSSTTPPAAASSSARAAPRPSSSTSLRATGMLLVHTEVPEAWGGRGIGGRLVRAALARGPGQRPDRGALVPVRPALAAGAPRRGGGGHHRLGDPTSLVLRPPRWCGCATRAGRVSLARAIPKV